MALLPLIRIVTTRVGAMISVPTLGKPKPFFQ
jgi:hypothetical protein